MNNTIIRSKYIRRLVRLTLQILPLFAGLLFSACNDKFGDDLRGLGTRVEILEASVLQINNDFETLRTLVETIQTNGFVTKVTHNPDGTCTIEFNDGRTVTLRDGRVGFDGHDGRDGEDGQDGQEATLVIGVWQDIDGMWYWTLNGQWLLDGDGNKVRAGAINGQDGQDGKDGKDGKDGNDGQDGKNGHDGKDGKDGHDGQNGIVPQVRINGDGIWEISIDGGQTWSNTGISANGKDGEPGRADIFASVVESADGKSLVVTLADGTEIFNIPIIE